MATWVPVASRSYGPTGPAMGCVIWKEEHVALRRTINGGSAASPLRTAAWLSIEVRAQVAA